mmetsp:Transcript_8405/g.15350  ORF Transcript_8405/g.15350 Transcript_8405/m.15350 type:complete len:127 (+) Transcript_8405:87-467(+)
MVVRLLPFFRRRPRKEVGKEVGKEVEETQEESCESMRTPAVPTKLLNEQDVQNNWLPDDLHERIAFMQALADESLPMPQNEAQFHAARVYSDQTGRSEYCLEQWRDYLQLHGYSIHEAAPMPNQIG